jgi:GMP synthase (glutamine-hydrolysing)
MLARQAPKTSSLDFQLIYPGSTDFKMPSVSELRQYDGCAFTGSSYSVYDSHVDVTRQLDLFRLAIEAEVSLFGSCWGLQVAAQALGGLVEKNPLGREVGCGRKISLTSEGQAHVMFAGKKRVFEAFMSHSDEVTRLPQGAQLLAGNDHTRVVAMGLVRKGVQSMFVQYHPEFTLTYYADLIASRRKRMCDMGFFKTGEDVDTYVRELKELARDSSRKDIAWKYGIDLNDLCDPDVKDAEPRNWLTYLHSR